MTFPASSALDSKSNAFMQVFLEFQGLRFMIVALPGLFSKFFDVNE